MPTRRREPASALLGAALLAAPSFAWVLLDRSVWTWDPAWYGDVSLSLWLTLRHEPGRWKEAMLGAFGIKAPGISWIGQFLAPLGLAAGAPEPVLLLEIVGAAFLSLLLFHAVARRLFPGNGLVAWAGTVALAASPLFAALSRLYFVEMLQLLAVLMVLAVATLTERWNPWSVALAAVAAGTFGMLVKVSTPLYVAVPLAWIALRRGRELGPGSLRTAVASGLFRAGLAATGLLAAGTGAWYLHNAQAIRTFVSLAASGPTAELYGSRSPFLIKAGWWLVQLRKALAPPEVALLALALVLLAFAARLSGRGAAGRRGVVPGSLLALSLVLGAMSGQVNEETRYLLPAVPYVVLLLCAALAAAGRRAVPAAWLGVAVLQFGWVHGVALGLWRDGDRRVSPWLVAPTRDAAPRARLEEVLHRTCTPETAGKIGMVALDLPEFNSVSLTLLSTEEREKTGRQCYYTSLGHGESDLERAWRRTIVEFETPYFVTWRPEELAPRTDAFNRVSLRISERVALDPAFREEPPVGPVRIFRRVGAVDGASGPAPVLPRPAAAP